MVEPWTDRLPPLGEGLRAELESLYRECDRTVESLGVACWARGDCCDFELRDHRLFASSVEVAYVVEKHPVVRSGGDLRCPFLRKGRCTERERRPLGCRTYFCDTRYREVLQALHERCLGTLRTLSKLHQFPWFYGLFVPSLRRAAPREDRAERPNRNSSPLSAGRGSGDLGTELGEVRWSTNPRTSP